MIGAILAAVEMLETYGPLVIQAQRGRQLIAELMAFIREHREIDGLTSEQRARMNAVLELAPGDVKL